MVKVTKMDRTLPGAGGPKGIKIGVAEGKIKKQAKSSVGGVYLTSQATKSTSGESAAKSPQLPDNPVAIVSKPNPSISQKSHGLSQQLDQQLDTFRRRVSTKYIGSKPSAPAIPSIPSILVKTQEIRQQNMQIRNQYVNKTAHLLSHRRNWQSTTRPPVPKTELPKIKTKPARDVQKSLPEPKIKETVAEVETKSEPQLRTGESSNMRIDPKTVPKSIHSVILIQESPDEELTNESESEDEIIFHGNKGDQEWTSGLRRRAPRKMVEIEEDFEDVDDYPNSYYGTDLYKDIKEYIEVMDNAFSVNKGTDFIQRYEGERGAHKTPTRLRRDPGGLLQVFILLVVAVIAMKFLVSVDKRSNLKPAFGDASK